MDDICPKCQKTLGEVVTTLSGRKLQRCTGGSWDSAARKSSGCDFVKWIPVEAQPLYEKCPKCSSNLVLAVTRFGKKMKKCSTGGWDKEKREATGCTYVEWINGTTEPLNEDCPTCGEKLVLYTTVKGKKMKKCSTSGWDREKREATGCTYVEWLKTGSQTFSSGEEFLPPEPQS